MLPQYRKDIQISLLQQGKGNLLTSATDCLKRFIFPVHLLCLLVLWSGNFSNVYLINFNFMLFNILGSSFYFPMLYWYFGIMFIDFPGGVGRMCACGGGLREKGFFFCVCVCFFNLSLLKLQNSVILLVPGI